MLTESNAMDTKYQDYMEYIFSTNPSIEYVILPHGRKMSKYKFLSKVYPLFAFVYGRDFAVFNYPVFNYPFFNINTTLNTVVNKEQLDDDLRKLFEQITSKIDELKYKDKLNFNLMTEVLLKFSILCENINKDYLNNAVSYKTSVFKIDNVLNIIEHKLNINGIMSETNSIFLDESFNNLQVMYEKYILSKNDNNDVTKIAQISKAFKSMRLQNKLREYFEIIYFEILLLTANTYNEYIKEQYSNGKW